MRRFLTFTGLCFALLIGLTLLSQNAHADWNPGGLFTWDGTHFLSAGTSTYFNGALNAYDASAPTSSQMGRCAGVETDGYPSQIGQPLKEQGAAACGGVLVGLGSAGSPITLSSTIPVVVHWSKDSCGDVSSIAYLEANCENDLNEFITVSGGAFVSFYLPTNGGLTGDFYQWRLNIANATPGTWAYVYYQPLGGGATYFDYNQITAPSGYQIVSKGQPLAPFLTSSTSWYAYATIQSSPNDPGGSVITTSAAITFTVGADLAPGLTATTTYITGETSTTIPITTNCQYTTSSFFGDPVGNIQNGICNALVFLFVPNSGEQQAVGGAFNHYGGIIAKKPPFGYLTVATDALSSFNSSTATSSQLLNASGTAALAPLFSQLDTGLALVISFVLLMWLYNRARHFNP